MVAPGNPAYHRSTRQRDRFCAGLDHDEAVTNRSNCRLWRRHGGRPGRRHPCDDASRFNRGAGDGMLRPDDPSIVATGQIIYADSCAGCHGENLEGKMVPSAAGSDELVLAPPHDGSGHTWQHPDQVLFDLTKYGASGVICLEPGDKEMPVFEDVLIDEQIVAVLSFIKSTWPEEIRPGTRSGERTLRVGPVNEPWKGPDGSLPRRTAWRAATSRRACIRSS